MKAAALVLSALFVIGTADPAHAQLGGVLGKAKKIGDKAADTKQQIDDIKFTEKEERDIGERVSMMLREKYGVMQDKDVTKYVTLVGTALAQSSSRPKIDWQFIVLDTDGVNAFATPGGLVHITKGLLGLMKNEAELAGVLGHEITHVTAKHSIRFIQQSKSISAVGSAAAGGGATDYLVAKAAERLGHYFLDNEFSRQDESEADEVGVRLASKLNYAPNGLAEALKKLDARNSGRADKNGMFASHPAIKDRIAAVEKQIKSEKLPGTATVAARYAQNITFDAKPVNDIAMVVDGASGLSGDGKAADKKDEPKKEEPKKKGGLLGKFSTSSSDQKQASQTTASAGTRGGVPDRDAKGGAVKSPVNVKITDAELEAFKKGIVA
jgi:predicted Zn-dependent protease